MQKFNFDYNKENDDLFLYNPKSKSKGSIEIGDLILDYNNKKEFVGIEIINASKMIKDMSRENDKTIRKLLLNLEKCKIESKIKKGLLIIKIYLFSKKKEISHMLTLPSIKEKSPALAYA